MKKPKYQILISIPNKPPFSNWSEVQRLNDINNWLSNNFGVMSIDGNPRWMVEYLHYSIYTHYLLF
jgi:hypothetical protein